MMLMYNTAKRLVKGYISTEKSIFQYFGCTGSYFIKPLEDYKWMIKEDEGIIVLAYWLQNTTPVSSIVVKKDGEPMVYKRTDYTMIIGIDCVKIAFILKNANLAEA